MRPSLWDDLTTQSEALLATIPLHEQKKLQAILSKRYRFEKAKEIQSKEEAILYLITRLPATFRVGEQVLRILQQVAPETASLKSIVDCGAGPGGARFLFPSFFKNLQTLTLLEKNRFMRAVGLALQHPVGIFVDQDYRTLFSAEYDLAYLSYTLSEGLSQNLPDTLDILWEQATWGLIIIEPGTPHGFKTIHTARAHLIQKGAHILAPCGHESPCPMVTPDWCHFSCRLPRTGQHQRLKEGTKPFEDEKFSYLIVSKNPSSVPLPPRLIRPPLKRKGHIVIDLCTKDGIQRKTLTPSKTPLYKTYGQLEWGDMSPIPNP